MRKKTRNLKIITLVMLAFISLVGCELYHSSRGLEITYYSVEMQNKIVNSIRIVQLTDLHNAVFGNNNIELISAVSDQNPDLIFVTGDLINVHDGVDTLIAHNLLLELEKIAPVYMSLGNHEAVLIEAGMNLVDVIKGTGIQLLDSTYVDVNINGDDLRIGGVYGYCQPVAHAIETHRENESSFLTEFQSTDDCKLLLCHIPVSWCNSYSLYDWDVDVVFSGHIHGGQVRIPFIGGLWAPDMGWFPGKVSGIYTTNEEGWRESRKKLLDYANYMKYDTSYYEEHTDYYPSFLVLSRGLGNTDWIPRFNNVPEIVVVDLVPNDESRDK